MPEWSPARAAGPRSHGGRAWLLVLLGVLLAAGPGAAGEQWGWLGVRIRDLTEQEMEEITTKLGLREGYGVLIAEVMPDTPARTAGLRDGDLIVAIDGRPIVETRALQRLVGRTAAGRDLAVVVLRDRRRQEFHVRVGRMPPDAVAERLALEFGFFVRDVAPEERAGEAGARLPVVAGVADGSSAAHGGLRAGDRVLTVNGREVTSLEGFRRLMQDLFLRDPMQLTVERRGERVTLTLPAAQPVSYQ
jgi:serine protease Do